MNFQFSNTFNLCMEIIRRFGDIFGWNYYETNTYLFLVLQPVIYILLGIVTFFLNVYTTIKYKPNAILIGVFIIIAIVGLIHSYYWWNELSTNTLPYLDNPTQLAKDVIKQLWQEGKTCEGYEVVNFNRYVYYFLAYIAVSIIINVPQHIYKHKKVKYQIIMPIKHADFK